MKRRFGGRHASYVALRFDVGAVDADVWSDALLAAGALSVEVSDPGAGTAAESPLYAEPGVDGPALWPVARVSALFDAAIDAVAALERAARAAERDVPSWEIIPIPEQDWVRAAQAQFEPIRIARDLWIVPTWCEPPDRAAVNLRLDPGVAFGTGSHPTTRLCLQWLRAYVTAGDAVLDYGCGSGILAIAAARLGARRALGTDIDLQALAAATANARANGVRIDFAAPAAVPPGTFDVVAANILARPLIELAPALAARLRAGGRIALAGILERQAAEVAGAYRRWFNIEPWRAREGWVLLSGVRLPGPPAGAAS